MTTQQEQESNNREVVVVLGVGRSGTSLAMQALETLGIRVSENIIPPNVSNPKGFYEDADIVEIHKQLLNTLTPSPAMPLQEGWINTPQARQALKQLKAIVEAQLGAGKGVWAFKDPRTATFLPLWIRLFNQLKIVPRFVMAIRSPHSFIQSFAVQSGREDQSYAELIFLLRTLDAIQYTDGNFYKLAYEDWFNKPTETLQGLADFLFENKVDITGIKSPASEILNRRNKGDIKIINPMVNELYQHLVDCHNLPEMRDSLLNCVLHQRGIVEAFRPWERLVTKIEQLNHEYREQLNDASTQKRRLNVCRQHLRRKGQALEQYQIAIKSFERLYDEME
ncbi:hypothetical protein LMS44_07565 [Halomonas profundus]|nr:hypothetical protein LMS44_07565 [Halomonas profundus]